MNLLNSLLFVFLLLFSNCTTKQDGGKFLIPYFFLLSQPSAVESRGVITGQTIDSSGNPLSQVKLYIDIKGKSFETTSDVQGSFSLSVDNVLRGEGYTGFFMKTGLDSASRVVIFDLPNLRVDLGKVSMRTATQFSTGSTYTPTNTSTSTSTSTNGNTSITIYSIAGQVIDDFSNNSLSGVTVSLPIVGQTPIQATTDADGKFLFRHEKIKLNDSYNLTLQKTNYITTSTVTAKVSSETNTIDSNPVRLYKSYGSITGTIMDDYTGNSLSAVSVTVKDAKGSTISSTTDAQGKYTLSSNYLLLGESYTITATKTGYKSSSLSVSMSLSGNNSPSGNPNSLYINGVISGTVGTASCGNVTLSTTDSKSNIISTTVTGGQTYTLTSAGFQKGNTYTITVVSDGTSPGCETATITSAALIEGTNTQNISLTNKLALGGGNIGIRGSVTNYVDNSTIAGATVKIGSFTGVTDSSGQFNVIVDNATATSTSVAIEIFKSGYSGNTDPQKLSETIDITAAQLVSATQKDIGNKKLYPIGIIAKIDGTTYNFNYQHKQSYEKFLTEKWGFTLSGRSSDNLNVSSNFYIHTDDTPAFPTIPNGWRHSSTLIVNGNPGRGVISEYDNDPRTGLNSTTPSRNNFIPSHPIPYHFYVSQTGNFTIKLTNTEYTVKLSATDSSIKLMNSAGTTLTTSTTGTISNYAISQPGWYFIEVSGTNSTKYGFFNIAVTGPAQSTTDHGTKGTWNTNNLILSFYNHTNRKIYIAGENETGSSGTITITSMGGYNQIVRGSFSGTLRAVDTSGSTISVTEGYFNLLRME